MARYIDADEFKWEIVKKGQASRRYKLSETWELNRNEIWEAVDDMPTAYLKNKHGEWIDQDHGATYPFECSMCHKLPLLDAYGDYEFSNFCPHCGADMRK